MSFEHKVTFCCDACDTNYMLDDDLMELPPGWLGMQVVIADSDGLIPEHEREVFCHFCSQDCLVEYASSDDMRQRLVLADQSIESPPPDGTNDENSG